MRLFLLLFNGFYTDINVNYYCTSLTCSSLVYIVCCLVTLVLFNVIVFVYFLANNIVCCVPRSIGDKLIHVQYVHICRFRTMADILFFFNSSMRLNLRYSTWYMIHETCSYCACLYEFINSFSFSLTS